ncbi:Methylthioribose-1-phosphate isomerase [Propionispora sp. 2/2-37]|uniref:S-methyl-5-thioribose-1-phosphate isomerase n=1 Tax=Propionispora sp. 2/2-37 TaxID=1677858 RepID=UPI0006BB99D7|nr:S-methyl-5-thioribose-1-phosphate isomerase [Propionispora sp. 2/2-37]CUH94250.1 Methylthioribose-1-phosphate isomerase [Propionispora sp. 2/2-37]
MRSLQWDGSSLTLLNQTLLPGKVEYINCHDYRKVADAIKRLEVRGAPAIGAAAAFAMVLGAREIAGNETDIYPGIQSIAAELKQTRPTAINLAWAVDRMLSVVEAHKRDVSERILAVLEREAVLIADEDSRVNQLISKHGAGLFSQPTAILTHCNTGALATVEHGTALGVIRKAWSEGNISCVFADETRPLLQGARLTAWELMQDHIPVKLITDNMAAWVMRKRMVQAVIVGADRITLNGDVANKIGTYGVAVLAREHNIPFYVAAPVSTFDFSLESGEEIPIEERNPEEITTIAGVRIAPEQVGAYNPAFDITPHSLITAIITEYGVIRAPYPEAIAKIKIKKGEN